MNPSENFTERLHVMVTPTQKRLIEEAAELRGFRSEGSVIRHLVDTHLPSLIQQGGKPVDIGTTPVTPFPRPSSLSGDVARSVADELFERRDTRVRTADPGPVKIRPSSMSRGWVERHEPDPVDQIRAAIARPAEMDEAEFARQYALIQPHLKRLYQGRAELIRRDPQAQAIIVVPHEWKIGGGKALGLPLVDGEVDEPMVAFDRCGSIHDPALILGKMRCRTCGWILNGPDWTPPVDHL